MVRVERNRTLVGVDGAFDLAGRLVDDAEIAVPVRLIRASASCTGCERGSLNQAS